MQAIVRHYWLNLPLQNWKRRLLSRKSNGVDTNSKTLFSHKKIPLKIQKFFCSFPPTNEFTRVIEIKWKNKKQTLAIISPAFYFWWIHISASVINMSTYPFYKCNIYWFIDLALSWRTSLSHRNQSDWFLYDRDLRHERVKWAHNGKSDWNFSAAF